MAVPAVFTDKLGPLPAWAWGLGLGGVIVVVQRVRDRGAAAPATEPADAPEGPPPPGDGFTMSPSPIGGGGTWAVAPVTEPASGSGGSGRPGYSTNEEWRRGAVDWLIAQRWEPIQASNAVMKLLDGARVTVNEAAVLRALLRDFGAPPQGHPPLIVGGGNSDPINPPPAPPTPPRPSPPPATPPGTPGTTPKPDIIRTVRQGDVLWNMTRSVYGRVDMRLVERVAAHNKLRWSGTGRNRQVSPWRIGQTVRFPPL